MDRKLDCEVDVEGEVDMIVCGEKRIVGMSDRERRRWETATTSSRPRAVHARATGNLPSANSCGHSDVSYTRRSPDQFPKCTFKAVE